MEERRWINLVLTTIRRLLIKLEEATVIFVHITERMSLGFMSSCSTYVLLRRVHAQVGVTSYVAVFVKHFSLLHTGLWEETGEPAANPLKFYSHKDWG